MVARAGVSAPADGPDNLDLIAFAELTTGVIFTGGDLAVHFHRDPFGIRTEVKQKVGHRKRGREIVGDGVHGDAWHPVILAA